MRIATMATRALPIMTALLSAALVLAACGGDDERRRHRDSNEP